MNEVKRMLSTQSVSAHVSVIVMGAVPSIASSQLKQGIKQLLQPDAEKMNGLLTTLSQSTTSGSETIDSGADNAKTGKRLLQLQNTTMQSVMRSLGDIDHGTNKVLDINSLMTAFENYLQAITARDGSAGVPIHFYVKHLSRRQLIQTWMEKYHTQNGAPVSEQKNETTNP
jgi:hypothetical protein